MAIVSTGLQKVEFVWMQTNKEAYSTATTANVICRPNLAAGTPGSFYPIAYKNDATPWSLNDAAATFSWVALGT